MTPAGAIIDVEFAEIFRRSAQGPVTAEVRGSSSPRPTLSSHSITR